MERIHMNHLRELIYRLRAGESQRRRGAGTRGGSRLVCQGRDQASGLGDLPGDPPGRSGDLAVSIDARLLEVLDALERQGWEEI